MMKRAYKEGGYGIALGAASAVVALPGVARAAAQDFRDLVLQIVQFIDAATLLLFSVALVVFFWRVVFDLWGFDGGNAEQKERLQTTLFWGIIVIFVMVSIWGIIQILQQTLVRGF